MNNTILERNLLALSSREANLAARLSSVDSDNKIIGQTAKNGSQVPVEVEEERHFPYHSLFNPEKESIRLAAEYYSGGYLIFLGFAGGYQIEPFLERSDVTGILIIESSLSTLKSFLSIKDHSRIILDSRVHFLADVSVKEVEQYLVSHCFPALFGNIQVIPLRSRVLRDKIFFTAVFSSVKTSLSHLADDFTVQSVFGSRWFKNTIINLETAQHATTILSPIKKAVITAAGPSLESDLDKLPELRQGACLIATDTSYHVLKEVGIKPDIIISIDCQHITYYHFLNGIDRDIPLVLDLASPPTITKLTDVPVFFTSGHPLSLYISNNWRNFPSIDTSGGNVTHAAVSLAVSLGTREIHLLGADFCYPQGKSYCRGTYIYPLFQRESHRFTPLDHSFFDFFQKNSSLSSTQKDRETCYVTQPLLNYKERLVSLLSTLSIDFNNYSPYWTLPDFPPPQISRAERRFFGAGNCHQDWRNFLEKFYNQLCALPRPSVSVASYLESLSPDQRGLWLTLLPALAQTRKMTGTDRTGDLPLLQEVLDWSCRFISKHFQA